MADTPTPAPQAQADIDALLQRLTAVLTAPDGVESGFLTSEFWLALVAVSVDLFGPRLGLVGNVTPAEQMLVAGLIAAVYAACRTWRKTHAAQLARIAQRLAAKLGLD